VAELNRKHGRVANDSGELPYTAAGHPSIEELMREQGTAPIRDTAMLRGEFWPEEESIEDFLAALHEWRGHKRTDPAA
jgi:hypothetical protein